MNKTISVDKHRVYEHLIVLFGYTFLTLLMSYPLILGIKNYHFSGIDYPVFVWQFWLFEKSLIELGTYPLYTDYIYYPTGASLAFHTLTHFNSLLSIPLQEIFGFIGAYNILFLLSYIVSGYGVYLLVKYLTEDKSAAFITGIIFAFCPYHFAHASVGQLNLLSTEWIPFYVLYFTKMFREDKKRNALLGALFLLLTSLCCWHYMGFMMLFTGFFVLYHWWFSRERITTKFLKRFAIMISLFFVMMMPFLYPMLPEIFSGSYMYSPIDYAYTSSADLVSFFVPGPHHTFLGGYTREIHSRFMGPMNERVHYAGYILIFLSLYYVYKRERVFYWFLEKISKTRGMLKSRSIIMKILYIIALCLIVVYVLLGPDILSWAIIFSFTAFFVLIYYAVKEKQIGFWLSSAVFFFLLSLGPVLHVFGEVTFGESNTMLIMPYMILHYLPFFSIFRAPGRFSLMLMLSLAVMSGFALRYIFTRIRRKGLFAILVSLLIIFEYLSIPLPVSNKDIQVNEFYKMISEDPGEYAILDIPIPTKSNARTMYMYYQITHEKKIVGGHISNIPTYAMEFIENTPIIQQLMHPLLIQKFQFGDRLYIRLNDNHYLRPNKQDRVLLRDALENVNPIIEYEGDLFDTGSIPNASMILNLNQSYPHGDIINQNVSEICGSVLNYYNIRYIIVHRNHLHPEMLNAVERIIDEFLDNQSPVYIDEEITVYEVEKNSLLPFITLGGGWFNKELWDDPPIRWMEDVAILKIITPEAGKAELEFDTKSFNRKRELEVYLNNKLIGTYVIGTEWSRIKTGEINLLEGENMVTFRTSNGCEEQMIWEIFNEKRCISLAFRDVSLEILYGH